MSSRWTHPRRLPVATAIVTLLTTGPIAVAQPAQAQVPERRAPLAQAPAKPPRDPVATAIRQAVATSEQVPVPSLTDEYSSTSANPDGTLTSYYSSSPQRVKQIDTWVPIDTTLIRRADGSYAPKATDTDLSVSGGGSTELLTMKDGVNALNFTWPTKLPPPVVSGSTATYREVLPQVDLQITADPTGYSSIIVLKSAQAAANPELIEIAFGLTGSNVAITETRNGGAEAVDVKTGETVFHTDTALMWDSTPAAGNPPAPAARADGGNPQAATTDARSPAAAAGRLGRNQAQVKIDITKGKQTLTLDQKLLTAKTTTYPVFVDPYWSGSPGKSQLNWARISSNGWDVYNSTSKTGATSARIGYDAWPDGAGERARTYYQMNTAGIKGAQIFEASLYVVERWAASCYNTAAVVYGTGSVSGWSSSKLHWGKEPSRVTGVLSTVNGREVDCGGSKVRVSPASLKFNVLSFIKTAAKDRKSNAGFLVQAKDMDDKYSWKQLGFGGGATLSVKYSYKPQFTNGTGNPQIRPSVVDQGRILTTTRTPTLTAHGYSPKKNGLQENVQIAYSVYNSAGTKVTSGYGPSSGYNLNGSPWPVKPALADGTYTWKAAIKNASGVWGGVWSKTQQFTVDTIAPKAPAIRSTQFPPGQLGGAYTDKGLFAFSNDRTNNVTGYLFSLDGDLSNVVYAANNGVAWTASTVLVPKTIYFAKADDGPGTGTTVINGTAGVSFAPGTAGGHRVFVKAVDQAGSTSPQTTHSFFAGTQTPAFAYGDKMISGWAAPNSDGSTTTVPPATTTSTTGRLISQPQFAGNYYADGYQAMLANTSTTSKVALGDSAEFFFNLPKAGIWEVGANLTTGADYGTYSLTLDQGTPAETSLLANFDSYSARTTTKYVNFDIIKDSSESPRTLAQGVHSVTLTVIGKNTASTGYQAGIDAVRLAPTLTCAIDNTAQCLNNTAISTYTPGTKPTVTTANADAYGYSLEAADLKAAGWTPGSTVTVNGAAIKLPAQYGTGVTDNMLTSGQIISVPGSGVVNKGNAVVFAGFATNGAALGATGTITYAGTSCGMRTQPYTIDTAPDWAKTTEDQAILTLGRRNKSDATQSAITLRVFAISVPLLCPGAPIASITLPLVTNVVQSGVPSIHLLGLGIRPTSITGSGPDAQHWVGSWAAAQDSAAVQSQPNSAVPSVNATLNNQTVRIPAHLSIGTGGPADRVRVRLANSLGKGPVTFDAVTIALQDDTAGGSIAAAAPVPLTFGGSRSVTLAAGTDVLSDSASLTATDRQMTLVSIKVRGALTSLPGHQDSKTPIYLSTADNADRTGDQAGTNFTTSAFTGSPFLSGIDVTTSTTNPAGSLVLYGDQTVNADTADGNGRSQLNSRLTGLLANAENGSHTVPFGVLNLGTSSWGNRGRLPTASAELPISSTATVDRATLHQANVRTVVISAGSSDLLACADTADACATVVTNNLTALTAQLRQYKSDDSPNPAVTLPNGTGGMKVYVATLPPFSRSHTAAQEAAREAVNDYILGTDGASSLGYADGIINFAAAVSTDGDHLSDTVLTDYLRDTGTGLFPSDLYYETLAQQVLLDLDPSDWLTDDQSGGTEPDAEPVAVWKFDEGTGDNAQDSGWGTGSGRVTHDATLHAATWGPGRLAGGKAATFNGSSSYATTDLKTNTAKSFTVSAWVRLTDKTADRTVFTRAGSGNASLYLQYQKSTDRWLAQMPSATAGDAVVWHSAPSSAPAQTGVWAHLAVTYDAELNALSLYVNGAADTSLEGVTPFNDSDGATWIGRSGSTWFAGDIADVRVWARVTNPAEIDESAQPELVADWQLEDDSIQTIAKDSTAYENDGTLTGGATYTYPGHNDWDIGALNFNGTSAAVTTGALLRTDQSFSVAAWVRLTKTDANYTVIGQEGAHTGRFMLQWSVQCGCWRFLSTTNDQAIPATTYADAPAGAALNTWTHLAGVYDATTATMTIYVNGEPSGSTVVTAAPWNSTGPFTVGRTRWDDHDTDWFPGDIDAIRVYQGAVSPELIKELSTA